MMGRPRLELSGIQLIASVLAAVTGAILASGLGVAGTITGTAVAAFASTAGGAVYRHYLGRTRERLRAVGPVIVQRARMRATAARPAGPYVTGGGRAATGINGNGGGLLADQPTQQFRAWGAAGSAGARSGPVQSGPGQRTGPGDAWVRPDDQPTQPMRSAGTVTEPCRQAGNGSARVRVADGQQATGAGWRDRRRQWLMAIATSVGGFVVVMAAITVFELATRKPLDSTAWGHKGSGTTIGNLVGGQQDAPAPSQ